MVRKTAALTALIILLWLGAVIWNYLFRATWAHAYTVVLFAIGFVSFIGFLNISREQRGAKGSFEDGDVRLALTCSFVAVFLALLSFYTFTLDQPTEFGKLIIGNFVTVTVVVVGFYFATSGAIELFRIREGRGAAPPDAQPGSTPTATPVRTDTDQ